MVIILLLSMAFTFKIGYACFSSNNTAYSGLLILVSKDLIYLFDPMSCISRNTQLRKITISKLIPRSQSLGLAAVRRLAALRILSEAFQLASAGGCATGLRTRSRHAYDSLSRLDHWFRVSHRF
jgi:hypothetical protein